MSYVAPTLKRAMKSARRSVTDADLRQFEHFANSLSASRGELNNFRFDQNSAMGGEAGAAAQAAFQHEAPDDDIYGE